MVVRVSEVFFPAGREHYETVLEETGFVEVETAKGIAQLGLWSFPEQRRIVSYCDGKATSMRCDTDEEFADTLEKIERWCNQDTGPLRPDTGVEAGEAGMFRALGLDKMFEQEPSNDTDSLQPDF